MRCDCSPEEEATCPYCSMDKRLFSPVANALAAMEKKRAGRPSITLFEACRIAKGDLTGEEVVALIKAYNRGVLDEDTDSAPSRPVVTPSERPQDRSCDHGSHDAYSNPGRTTSPHSGRTEDSTQGRTA